MRPVARASRRVRLRRHRGGFPKKFAPRSLTRLCGRQISRGAAQKRPAAAPGTSRLRARNPDSESSMPLGGYPSGRQRLQPAHAPSPCPPLLPRGLRPGSRGRASPGRRARRGRPRPLRRRQNSDKTWRATFPRGEQSRPPRYRERFAPRAVGPSRPAVDRGFGGPGAPGGGRFAPPGSRASSSPLARSPGPCALG